MARHVYSLNNINLARSRFDASPSCESLLFVIVGGRRRVAARASAVEFVGSSTGSSSLVRFGNVQKVTAGFLCVIGLAIDREAHN
jgi:hypothetical protein